jgi:hypothetical protein
MLDLVDFYHTSTAPSSAAPTAIDGRRFGRLSKSQRAVLAADVLEGRLSLRPTATAIAKVMGVSVPYITAASKLSTMERYKVRWGLRTLREVISPTPSPEERLAKIVDEIGVDAALELLARSETAAAA